MSPIPGVTDSHWLPRLGKIRLGKKKQGQKGMYPVATDYFVCPDEVIKIYGETPRELDVMFPSEKMTLFAPAWYKAYSYSQGKICEGDGRSTAGVKSIRTPATLPAGTPRTGRSLKLSAIPPIAR